MKGGTIHGKNISTSSVCLVKPSALPKWRVRFFFFLLSHHSSVTEPPLIAATVSDFILVVAPLWIIRGVRVSHALRIRLIAIFSCSIITTAAGLTHAILILKMPGALEAIMGEQFSPSDIITTPLSQTLSPIGAAALAAREVKLLFRFPRHRCFSSLLSFARSLLNF